MVVFRDPERSVVCYVSTGSAGNHHLQAGMNGVAIGPSVLNLKFAIV